MIMVMDTSERYHLFGVRKIFYFSNKSCREKNMYRKILVPVDFSEYAHNALKVAIAMAKKVDAQLVLLHAFDIPVPSAEMGLVIDTNLAEDFERESEQKMKELYTTYPELGSLVAFHKIKVAFPSDAIMEEIDSGEIDLIIMGTHGAHSAFDELVGSNTLHVIQKSGKPVLAIPGISQMDSVKEILFAFDYQSITNSHMLQPLVDFARSFAAQIHILHITEHIQKLDSDAIQEAKNLEQYLKDIPHHYHMLESKDVESGIEEYLQKHQIDVLAVMPRKHTLWDKIFKSSVTRKLIHHSNVPLLVFPEAG